MPLVRRLVRTLADHPAEGDAAQGSGLVATAVHLDCDADTIQELTRRATALNAPRNGTPTKGADAGNGDAAGAPRHDGTPARLRPLDRSSQEGMLAARASRDGL